MASSRVLLCLVALLFVSGAAAQDDPFRTWLHSLNLTVPPMFKVVKDIQMNVSLDTMVCGGIDFQKISSSYQPLSFTLGLSGLVFTCRGHFSYASTLAPHLIHGGGDIHVGLSDATSLSASLSLVEDQYGLAIAATLNNFVMSISFSEIVVTGGFVEKIVSDFFKYDKKFTAWFSGKLDSTIEKLLTNLVNNNLTKVLTEIDDKIRPFVKPVEPSPAPPVPPGSVDLQKNALIRFLNKVLDDKIGPVGLNNITDRLTNGTGILQMHNMSRAVFGPIHLASIGTLTVGISDFVLAGLDSWSQFQMFVPHDNYTLDTLTAMDSLVLNLTFFLNITVDGTSPLQGTGLYEKAEFYMNLAHNSLKMRTQLALNSTAINMLTGTQFVNLGCLCTGITDVNFTEFLLNTTVKDLRLIAQAGQSEADLEQAIDNLLALFTHSFGAAIPAFLNGVISGPLRSVVNELIADAVAAEAPTCKPPSSPAEIDSITVFAPFTGAFIVFLVLSLLASYLARVALLRASNGEYKPLLGGASISDSESPFSYASTEPALVIHPQISFVWRYGIIFLICMNMALFIFSNINTGASVYILLTSGGESVRLPDLFEFSLANSVRDMWHAKVYPLSLLIAVFSGGWPYAKLLLMLACWIAPTSFLRTKTRESVLMVVDMLGKWSLIDSFVMVLMLVAFRFHVGSNPAEAADVYVEPGVGIYTFVAATMLSLFISHLCLYFDRSISPLNQVLKYPADSAEALKNHHFAVGGRIARCTRLGQIVLPLALLFSLASLVGGAVIDSFEFVFKGAAGWALGLLGTDPATSFSLISLGENMPFSSANPDSFGVRFLQVTFFTFALGMPLAHMISTLFLWLVPLSLRAQNRLFVMVEVFNAWAALDVFVLTIIASLLEIQQFAAFIVGSNCDAVNVFLTRFFAPQLDGDDVCFDVVTKLAKGCYVLFGGAVVWLLCSIVVMRTCHSALHERKLAASRAASAINYMQEDASTDKSSSSCKCCPSCSPCQRVSLLFFYLGCLQGETLV